MQNYTKAQLWRYFTLNGCYPSPSTCSPYQGYFPMPPTQTLPAYCPPATRAPCVSLVSSATESQLRGADRTANYTAAVAGMAAGATVGTTIVAPSVDTLASNSMWRTIQIVDIIGTGLPADGLDAFEVVVTVGGFRRATFNAGVFSRGNANACTPACGISVCAGPLETIAVTVRNQTGAAIGAAATFKLTTRTAYSGEPGFTCAPDNCEEPLPTPPPPLPTPPCECGPTPGGPDTTGYPGNYNPANQCLTWKIPPNAYTGGTGGMGYNCGGGNSGCVPNWPGKFC